MKTRCTRAAVFALLPIMILFTRCSKPAPSVQPAAEEEAIARTEFTERMENFFEYEPLRAGKASQFRIHLTDLTDGAPVEKAEVTLTVRPPGVDQAVTQTTARIGKVTGIYVADLNIARPGEYDIEFHIKNSKLDERMPLSSFKVE